MQKFARHPLFLVFAPLLTIACLPVTRAPADPWRIEVEADKPGAAISPSWYGLMTEEINHAYDGGLYAELVQNRSFKDDAQKPAHWSLVQDGGGTGAMALDTANPVNAALDVSLKLDVTAAGTRVGVANEGFWGIPVRPHTSYQASFFARSSGGLPLNVAIESNDGETVFAHGAVAETGTDWKQYTVTLTTGAVEPSAANRLVISTTKPGTFWLSLVSLFPPTYKNRANGNRIDLMEKLAALKPAFLRFPGGNYVDPGHYEWKITLGPVEQRTGHPGAWKYRSSDGLGLLEFLEWCEDLHMEPLLAVSDGRPWLPAEGDIGPLVQDAVDEIEYVTGGPETKWGATRIADGHPAPFPLRYVEIGNEDFFDKLTTYDARFARFFDAIRAKYPRLQIIATRADIKSRVPDIVDDHIYASPAAMVRASHRYDNRSRTGPKIFVGEWATQDGIPTPTLRAALSDAVYLMGLERNADLVMMSCYAPLLTNVNPGARQWPTNLIGYDALNSFGSPSYYMQAMFSANLGSTVLPVRVAAPEPAKAPAPPPPPHGSVGVGTYFAQAEFKDAQVTHDGTVLLDSHFDRDSSGWTTGAGDWRTQDGALVQSGNQRRTIATGGDAGWTDYTYRVKARKTAGTEGFLIYFHVASTVDLLYWEIGSRHNSRADLQRVADGENVSIGEPADVTVETGRWYDVQVEVKGRQIRCLLDGKLITEATDPEMAPPEPIHANAARDAATGDIILKVVNLADTPQTVAVELHGAGKIAPAANGQVLTGQPADVNSIAEPAKVAPSVISINDAGPSFQHEFPAHSFSVIRLKNG